MLTAGAAGASSAAAQTAAGVQTGAVRGAVYDSLAGRPLAGATVQIVARDAPTVVHTTISDSTGAFRFDSLPPGNYLIGFLAPLLDVLEVEVAPRETVVAAGTASTVTLAVPGSATMRTALCGTDARAAHDSTGLLVGLVRDADTERTVSGARVVLTWNELVIDGKGLRTERRRVPVPVRPSGTYVACDVPADAPSAASAEAPGRATGLVEVTIGPSRFLRRDLTLGDSIVPGATGGAARLAGVVRDPNGRPVRGARIQVWGSEVQGTTGEDGRFALERLPAGTRTVEVRAIGYAPRRTAVDLAPGRPASIQLAMAKPAPVLDRVTVLGRPSRATAWQDEFLKRQRAGWGRFYTASDVERQHPLYVTDMLRLSPGVRLAPGHGVGYGVRLRGGCEPAVVIDGMPIVAGADDVDLLVQPQDLAGIEIYNGPAGIPLQYGGLQANGCGAVLLWTKR